MEKPIWMICVTHMFLELYLLIQASLIPVIIQEFQLNLLEASLVVTVPSLVQLSMNIPSGFFADRLNTNHLLFASMLIEGGSALLVSQTNTFWTLVLGVSLMRIASPIYHISGLSQISRITKPEQIGRSIGFHNALGSLGSAIGVVSLAIFLSTTLGWRWTYLFWAIPILIWGFIILMSPQLKTWRFEKTKNTNGNGLKRLYLIFSSGLLIFLIAIGFREVGNTGSSTFMTTYFVEKRNLSVSTASLIFGLGPFVGIIGSLGGGYLGERRGAKKALSWSIICCAISLFVLSLVSHLYLLIPVYLFYAFFSNLVWAPMNMIVANTTSVTERELSYSVYFFTEGLIASIAPTLAVGVIGLANDVWLVFPFSIAFILTSLIILQFLPKPKRK
jgi:predicted MFS family arabinose efflux permease